MIKKPTLTKNLPHVLFVGFPRFEIISAIIIKFRNENGEKVSYPDADEEMIMPTSCMYGN